MKAFDFSASVIGLYSMRLKPLGVSSQITSFPLWFVSKPIPVTRSSGSHRFPAKYSKSQLFVSEEDLSLRPKRSEILWRIAP
jgi:hypothetical protein